MNNLHYLCSQTFPFMGRKAISQILVILLLEASSVYFNVEISNCTDTTRSETPSELFLLLPPDVAAANKSRFRVVLMENLLV